MPKKKKGKLGVDSSPQTGGWTSVKRHGQPAAAGDTAGGDEGPTTTTTTAGDVVGYSEEEIRTQELRYLQDMFAGKLDPVVVHMIMNDCEFKVEATLETLFELADQTSATESQMYRLSGFQDVYIPKMEVEDQVDEDQEEEDQEEEEKDSQYLRVSPLPDRLNRIVMHPQLDSSWDSENSASRGGADHQLRSRRDVETVQFPPRDHRLHTVTKDTIHQASNENSSYVNRADSSQGEGMASSQALRTDLRSEQDSSGRVSSINNLSQNETSESILSSRDERGGSKKEGGAEIEPSPESEIANTLNIKMNIRMDDVPPGVLRAKTYVSGIPSTEGIYSGTGSPGLQTAVFSPERKDDQFIGEDASAPEVETTGRQILVSDDLQTHLGDTEIHPKKASITMEQLFGRRIVAPFEAILKQDPPSRTAEITSGSPPVELPSDDLETLLGEIELCPEKASMSGVKAEPSSTERSPGIAFEASSSNDRADIEKGSGSPVGVNSGTDSYQNDQVSSGQSLTNEEPNHQPNQIEIEGAPRDDQQQHNLNIAAPAFIPRSFARHPSLPGHHQYQPIQVFQPGHAEWMPRVSHPAGRASSLQRHLNHPDGEFGKPFFTPFRSSQEQRPTIPRGVETQGRRSPQLTQRFSHPAQNFPSHRPILKSHLQAPSWQQNRTSHQRQRYPSMSNQPFQPRTTSPVHGMTRECTPPPERLRTISPHEGARRTPDLPQWPIVKHTSYALRAQSDSTRQAGTDDKAVLLPGGKVLCLMRGCPGSGKSTLAKKLVGNGKIISTDDYFVADGGQYHFDITKLSDAHDWSHKRAQEAMESGVTPLIIDNTNIERWTMKPYVAMALQHGYTVKFREPTTPWKFKVGKLHKYNTHGLSRERIKLMVERYERDVTVDNILGSSKPTKMRRKMAEAAKRPPSPKSWRRPKKEEKCDLEVDGISNDAKENKETSWRNQRHRVNATTGKDDDVIAASSTVVEGSSMPVAASATDASAMYALATDDLATDALTTDAKKEEGQSEDEMFMSEDGDDLDALMDLLACDSVEEVEEVEGTIPRADEHEVTEVLLGDHKDEEEEEGEEAMITSETEASCETDAKSGPRISDEIKTESSVTDVRDDAEKTTEENVTSGLSSEMFCEVDEELSGVKEENMHKAQSDELGVRGTEEDDFLAMVNAITEVFSTPFPEIVSPNDDETLRSEGREDKQQVNSIDSDEFQAVMSSFAQAPCQPTDGLPSKSQELQSRMQKEDDGDKESSYDENDFATMINLVADACCVQSHREVAASGDGIVTDTQQENGRKVDKDVNDHETTCSETVLASIPMGKKKSHREAQTRDDKTEDDAEGIVSVEEAPCDVGGRREKSAELQQQENLEEADRKNEDEDDFSAMMKAVTEATSLFVAETSDVEKQILDESQNMDFRVNENVQNSDIRQEIDSVVEGMTANTTDSDKAVPDLSQTDINNSSSHCSGSQGNEPSGTSLDIKADSVLEDTPGADECIGCGCECEYEHEYFPKIIKEEPFFGTTKKTDGSQHVRTSADGSDSRNSTREVQVSSTIENEGCLEEMSLPERKLETTGDINSNNMDSINHRRGMSNSKPPVTEDPSNLTDSLSVSNSEVNVHTVPSLTQPPRSVTPTCRSPSPCLLVSPSSLGESIVKQRQDRRNLRRSRSLKQCTKMAAVFPLLSPASGNWSDLAPQVGQAGEGNVEQLKISSADFDSVFKSEAGTMTLASDFSCFQKFESGKLTVVDLQKQGLQVSFGQARQISASDGSMITTEEEKLISEPCMPTLSDDRSPIPATVKLHKSTMTDCENQTEDVEDKLKNLIALFPSVSQNDLEDILTRCTGDMEWATNILLDDIGIIERSDRKVQDLVPPGATDGSLNINQAVESSGAAKVEPRVEESELNAETLAEMATMKELLEAKQVSQAGNLATSMMSVVDDILKTISSEETKHITDNAPIEKEQSAESDKNEIDQVGSLDQFSFLQANNLLRKFEDNSNINLKSSTSHRDSTRVVSPDVSDIEQEPVQSRVLQRNESATIKSNLSRVQDQSLRDVDFSGERSKANKEDPVLQVEELRKLGPLDMQVARGIDSQFMLEESDVNILEGPLPDAAYGVRRSQPTESENLDGLVDYTNSASAFPGTKQGFYWSVTESQQGPDPDGARREIQEEQVVRPKTQSRTVSRRSPTKVSKIQKLKDVDIFERMSQVLVAEAPLRRDELEAVGGVQFSWNDQGQEEEFRVPRPEQMMTGGEDAVEAAVEAADGSVMTEEQADAILQGPPVARKRTELRSLKEGLLLQLPPAFALQLQEMFGSIGFHLLPDGLPAEDLQVHVDYDLAKKLHSLWGQALQTRFNQEEELDNIIKADEELARKLQQEEDIHHMTKVQSARSAKYQGSKAFQNRPKQPVSSQLGYGDSKGVVGALASSPVQQGVEEDKGLREIMEEELAAQLSKDVEVEEKLGTEGSVSIATKLKRDKLFSEFPTLDRGVLEDIFRANNYLLDPTIKQVQSFFISASGQPKNVYTNEALDRIEKELIEIAERESLSSSEGTDDSNQQEGFYQSMDTPEYQDYRAEATQHYGLRHKAFQKAAAAYNRGQRDLASFYSQQGHLHTEKLKAANKRASEAILTSKNSLFSDNTLDLHGLHVEEALLMLNQVLIDKKAEISAYSGQQPHPPVGKSPHRHIFIVTGKGNRSRGGVARIRPAVTDFLQREGYTFSMPNAGLVKVVL